MSKNIFLHTLGREKGVKILGGGGGERTPTTLITGNECETGCPTAPGVPPKESHEGENRMF